MQEEIKIQAQILAAETCQFVVDRPVFPDAAIHFSNRNAALGAPLAEKLFAIDRVTSVTITDNVVKVTKAGDDDWLPIAKQVGAEIRAQLKSGVPAVSDAMREKLPSDEEIRRKVSELLESQINPAVAGHGGRVSLVDVKGNIVYLQLGGGCHGCGMADVTLKMGIEKAIRQLVPEVGDILDVTDHSTGRNPYYSR